MRRPILAAVAALLAGSVVALAMTSGDAHVARADLAGTPTNVGALGCFNHGGHQTVPAGSSVVVTAGFASSKLAGIQAFLGAETSILSVQDGSMLDVSGDYSDPTLDATGNVWITRLSYPTGVTLANSGDSMRFTFTVLFSRPVTDVSDLDGNGAPDPQQYATGLQYGGTCTVTAS